MKNLYSPTMLKSYLACKYIIFNEVNEKNLNLKRIELTKNDQLRMDKGNIHEKNYLKDLKKKYKKIIDIKNLNISREEKIKKTIESMEKGYEIIHGGYLKKDKWVGEFDFLEISKTHKSKFGNYSYQVIDTKNSNRPKPDHIIQLGPCESRIFTIVPTEDLDIASHGFMQPGVTLQDSSGTYQFLNS